MRPDPVSNTESLALKADALPTALRGPLSKFENKRLGLVGFSGFSKAILKVYTLFFYPFRSVEIF